MLKPSQGRRVIIEFVPSQDLCCSGEAYLGSNEMLVRIPRKVNKADLALTIAHETAHAVLNLNHSEMRGPQYNNVGNWEKLYAWALEFPLERQQSPFKQNLSPEQKLGEAVLKLEEWENKLILAQNKVARYKKRVEHYARKLNEKDEKW